MSLLHHAKEHISNQSRYGFLNAFISLHDRATILARAEAAEKTLSPRARQIPASDLKGRLIGIKDNICTADLPTTAASGILKNFTSPYDATVVKQLRDAGAIIAGKTNMDEFGMGSHSTHSNFGAVEFSRHEGEQLSAGGSSGGSAVAVATGQCWAALGTDTGGSVRLPAAYTGIVGFKPSYGLLSRWGVIAYANSLDTVGIMGETVDGVEGIFNKLNHHDPQDPTSLPPSTRAKLGSKNYPVGLRIGIPLDYNISTLSSTIRRSWIQSLRHLNSLGHTLHPVNLPTTQHALSAYYVLAPAEASSNLAKYDGVRYGSRAEGIDGTPSSVLFAKTRGEFLGAEVKRRILLGAFTLSADAIDNYFIQAQKVRRLVSEDFNLVFAAPNPLVNEYEIDEEGVDVLLCPTAPTLPPSLSEVKHQEPLDAYMNDVFTVPASLAGLPAISVPVPIAEKDRNHFLKDSGIMETAGMQIIGQFGHDSLVLDVARQLTEADNQSHVSLEARDFEENLNRGGTKRTKAKWGVNVPGYGRIEKYPTTREKRLRKQFGSQAKELGISVEEYIKTYGETDVPKPE